MGNLGHLPWPLWETYGFHVDGLAALEGTCMATFSVPSEVSDGETSTHLFFFLSCENRGTGKQAIDIRATCTSDMY